MLIAYSTAKAGVVVLLKAKLTQDVRIDNYGFTIHLLKALPTSHQSIPDSWHKHEFHSPLPSSFGGFVLFVPRHLMILDGEIDTRVSGQA
ncbi:MAG UNVERIFIED_CONTAM: hypothetical protein LVR29_20225 [Microcystis novacekii LVE1205-3]